VIEPTDEMLRAFDDAAWSDPIDIAGEASANDRAGLAAVLAIVERDYLSVMRDLVAPDPCWFDHHGGCQAHGFISLEPGEKCPHAQAKELLGLESSS